MPRRLRLIITWLLLLALPLQGWAAASMMPARGAAPGHVGHGAASAQGAELPPCHLQPGQGGQSATESKADSKVPSKASTQAGALSGSCSACAACCLANALTSSGETAQVMQAMPTTPPQGPTLQAWAYLTGAPERPPRTPLR